jgi:hypothetical protein
MKQGEADEGVEFIRSPQDVDVHPRSIDDAREQGQVTLETKAVLKWSGSGTKLTRWQLSRRLFTGKKKERNERTPLFQERQC